MLDKNNTTTAQRSMQYKPYCTTSSSTFHVTSNGKKYKATGSVENQQARRGMRALTVRTNKSSLPLSFYFKIAEMLRLPYQLRIATVCLTGGG